MRAVYVVTELSQGCLNQVFAFDDEESARAKARELIPSPAYDSGRGEGVPDGTEKTKVGVWKADHCGGDLYLVLTE